MPLGGNTLSTASSLSMIEKDSGSEDGKNSSERASESTAATDLDWHPDDLDPEEVLAEIYT